MTSASGMDENDAVPLPILALSSESLKTRARFCGGGEMLVQAFWFPILTMTFTDNDSFGSL